MHRNKSVSTHQFAMIPRADIPRSSFRRQYTHKTTFDAMALIPVLVDEVLPGDSFKLSMTAFFRMATPVFPLMDNLYLESFFFFVPCRLVWSNWQRFMGQQDSPADSISYTVPVVTMPDGGFPSFGMADYFGLPTVSELSGTNKRDVNALPFRAYNLIYNTWFRDENMQNGLTVPLTDGPDSSGTYLIKNRGKRHDYFTSCLPWAEKGGVAVTLPLGTSAPVKPLTANSAPQFKELDQSGVVLRLVSTSGSPNAAYDANGTANNDLLVWSTNSNGPGLYADLSAATAATINQLRQSFQVQKLLERDARGGTRYTEIVRSHFGVISPDARLQRPEYLGGGSTPIQVSPVPQTSATNLDGSDTPQGNLAAMATGLAHNHGFTQAFTEHGYVIGLVSIRADLTYQQGIRKMWSRSTRYDFYFPVFAALGEQAVLNQEIFCDGTVSDAVVFGYQERWAEYRYFPSMVTGYFRSNISGTLDAWHLAENFSSQPVLDSAFISSAPPVERVVAAGSLAVHQQFIFDAFFDIASARPMPMYSVPGLIDHF